MPVDISQLDWGTLVMLVAVVVVVWFVVRAVFKLAVKVFTCGCAVIFLLAVALVVWRVLAGTGP